MPRISALSAITSPAEDDELAIVDTSENTTKKVTFGQIMPTGSILDFAGANAPDGWLLCYGQALNANINTQYQALYDIIGNTYGGSSNQNFVVPDLRGRVIAGQDDMGGTSANRLTGASGGVNGDTFGATGGAETHTLTTAELAVHTHPFDYAVNGSGGGLNNVYGMPFGGASGNGSMVNVAGLPPTSGETRTGVKNNGSGSAHNNVQPTIILNKIIKY